MRDLEANDREEAVYEKLVHGGPQQEGQPAPKWEGACSVVQGDQSTPSRVTGAQGGVGKADLGQVLQGTNSTGLISRRYSKIRACINIRPYS